MSLPKGADIYRYINEIAPYRQMEEWDNCGFQIGDPEQEVERAVVALDCTASVLEEAQKLRAQLIVTHHPIIFRPLRSLTAELLVYRLAQSGIGCLSAHTNYDVAAGGVNDILARRLGLRGVTGFAKTGQGEDGSAVYLGRVGSLEQPLTPEKFGRTVKERLGCGGLRMACPSSKRMVGRVAVLGGAGGDFLAQAASTGADAFVTAEIKHNQWLDACDLGITLVDAGHFSTEHPAVEPLRRRLESRFPEVEWHLSDCCGDPVLYI